MTNPDHRPSDGKRGCPVTTWDGPYSMRCALGGGTNPNSTQGQCAYHGPFKQPANSATCSPTCLACPDGCSAAPPLEPQVS